METHENMAGLTVSAEKDSSIDRTFLAKNALQLKLSQKMMKSSADPDHDYEAFIEFSVKYGDALKHVIAEHPDLSNRVLNKVLADPDAPLDPVDFAQIQELLDAPAYSKYLH